MSKGEPVKSAHRAPALEPDRRVDFARLLKCAFPLPQSGAFSDLLIAVDEPRDARG